MPTAINAMFTWLRAKVCVPWYPTSRVPDDSYEDAVNHAIDAMFDATTAEKMMARHENKPMKPW